MRAFKISKSVVAWTVTCGLCLCSGLVYCHETDLQHEHKILLNQLEHQSNRLRTIEQLLEGREAQARAREISSAQEQEVLTDALPSGSEVTRSTLTKKASALERWFSRVNDAERAQIQTPSVGADSRSLVKALVAEAPSTMAVALAFERFPEFSNVLTSVLSAHVNGADDVAAIVNWLAFEPDLTAVSQVIAVVLAQGQAGELVEQLHEPIRHGARTLGHAYQQAAFEILMRPVEREYRRQMLADLERLLVYGQDRVFTHSLLAQYYQGLPDQQADWRQLVERAWGQASIDPQSAKVYAPCAAHAGVTPALLLWVATATGDTSMITSLAQLVDVPTGVDILSYVRASGGALDFDVVRGRYILER